MRYMVTMKVLQMRSRSAALAAALAVLASPVLADAPAVAVDIPPVHSLVARVMEGVGEPALVVKEGASPHGYSMRPSEAAALQDAEVVFWTSPELTPWFQGALETLAPDARTVELIEADGATRLEFREGATFEAHDHAHEGDDAEHGRDHERGADEDPDDHAHEHEGVDPHAWLDPANARLWLGAIARTLAETDPDNAEAYRRNAGAAQAEMDDLTAELEATVAPVRGRPYIVFHDAYQYFGQRFDIPAAGAISLSDASEPSPARVAEVRDLAAEVGAVCVFTEPQFRPGVVRAVFGDGEVRTAVLDPMGVGLEAGPGLYPALLRKLAGSLADCLR